MPPLVLFVDRKILAWTYYEVGPVSALPSTLRKQLERMDFEERSNKNVDESLLVLMQQHSGHTPHIWSTCVQLLRLGFDFKSERDRIEAENGKSAIMTISVTSFQVASAEGGLTLNVL
jgi:hypothetical protein